MPGIIVYYLVGPVHPRNLKMIADELPDWTFRATYERFAHWMNAETLAVVPGEKIPMVRGRVPDSLWSGDVRAVVFSTTQPRPGPIELLQSAMERGVPTIAVEESNQIVFNNGTVNNYLMPVDHLLVASDFERQGMIAEGVPKERVEVTGWPFYAGGVGKTAPERRRQMKERFGLDPHRPVATLGLTALNDAGESPAVRKRQLMLAAEGLPLEYQLAVKPHPIEKLEVLMPFIAQYAPRAHPIDGRERIDDVLEATDVLLNRGRSQVSFEALFREIPVIILDCGGLTPFHGLAEDLIVEDAGDLTQAIGRLDAVPDPMSLYEPMMKAHIPYPPGKARELTSRRIAEIASSGERAPDRAGQWFALATYQAFVGNQREALKALSHCGPSGPELPTDALRNLLQFRASRGDIEQLSQHTSGTFLTQVLRCLWIDQLERRGESPGAFDLAWMKGFPPPANTVWFLRHLENWASLLVRSGQSQAALDLAKELGRNYMHVQRIPGLVDAIARHDTGFAGRMGYLRWRMNRLVRSFLRKLWVRLYA